MAYGFLAFGLYTGLWAIGQRVVSGRYAHMRPSKVLANPLQPIVASIGMTLIALAVLGVLGDGFRPSWGHFTWPLLRGAGIVVILAGLVLGLRTQAVMGANWFGGVGLFKRHSLATTGPYKWVRHPMYASMILAGMGCTIVGLDVWLGIGIMLFLGSYALRIPGEEILLRQRFKARFNDYAASTPALLPRLWRRRT